MNPKKLLVVGTHSADFVWRSAGTIATTIQQGGNATVIALSYGERGESGNLWRDNPDQTIENVKRIRHEMAEEAASHVGADFRCLDLGDYPLVITDHAMNELIRIIVEDKPGVILTHTAVDPFNPDHPIAYTTVQRARLLASGAGVASAFQSITPPDWYSFEPHQPELSEFYPTTFVDITPVMDKKIRAMNVMSAQGYLIDYYTELASRRGNHARRIAGKQEVKFAEAHQRLVPQVVSALLEIMMNENEKIARLAELGTATVYEASGHQGLIDLPLIQVVPRSRIAGKAHTVLCGQGDNVMVHACIEHIQAGEIVVRPSPNRKRRPSLAICW